MTAKAEVASRAPTYGNVIDGVEESLYGARIARHNPANGELVASYADSGPEDVARAVDAARREFDRGSWRRQSSTERGRVLLRWADLIARHHEDLVRIEVEEVGKTVRQARSDIDDSIDLVRYAAGLGQQLAGESFSHLGEDSTAWVAREPVGVVGAIVPWNFPALVFCQKAPFALAAGCTVVAKPSEFTSGSAVVLARLALEAGVPAGAMNVVTGYGKSTGRALAHSRDVDMVSFTGSTATGAEVIDGQKTNFKRIALELGGKAASIVFADADREAALDGVLQGVCLNQGECCVSGARLIIEDTIADEFVDELTRMAGRLRTGDPFDERTDIGALIHERHLDRVLDFIEQSQTEGARLLCGGKRLRDDGLASGCFVPLTILDDVRPEMAVFREEIFGPVLSVVRFRSLDEAVRLSNLTDYGLANSVWSRDVERALTVASRLQSGTVWVNTTLDGAPQLPAGGYKSSGVGREMGRAGLEEFTELKSVRVRHGSRRPFFQSTQ